MNKKILIIEDDIDIAEALTYSLEFVGYEVSKALADSYHDVFHPKNKDNFPHLVLLDILLSGKDGREICKELKSDNKTKHIPIIMMSAYPDAHESVKKAKANDFLPKPFDINDLLAKIHMHMI
jgi:DNA-binding response OmpR family regulator